MNKFVGPILATFLFFSLSVFSQSPVPVSDSSATAPKQFVKIEVGMHILDCPVLPPQLKAKLLTLKGIKDYQEDQLTESIYFNLPEGVATKEQIVKIALSCSFPAQAINVLVANKPFTN